MAINATPVGFAHPPIRPKSPGLLVKSHSFTVKFAELMTGSLTTMMPKKFYFINFTTYVQLRLIFVNKVFV